MATPRSNAESSNAIAPASNPWEDVQPPTVRRAQTTPSMVHHRLSFDHATGVIMIPDDENWLVDDVDSDEDDYGVEDVHQIQRTQTEPTIGSGASEDEDPSGPSLSVSPSRTSRYGTYFHHPERRRQTIPGAFPRPTSLNTS